MRHYEIVFIVHPDQSEQVPAMIERYKTMVTQGGGKIHRIEDWGRRQMAYPDPEDVQGALRADEHRNRARHPGRTGARVQVQRRCAAPPHREDGASAVTEAIADDEGREVQVADHGKPEDKEAARQPDQRAYWLDCSIARNQFVAHGQEIDLQTPCATPRPAFRRLNSRSCMSRTQDGSRQAEPQIQFEIPALVCAWVIRPWSWRSLADPGGNPDQGIHESHESFQRCPCCTSLNLHKI